MLARMPARSLIALQPSGSRRPFFCVHPAGGTVFCYRDLARCLGTDQPFYAFQAAGLYGDPAPRGRLESIAAAYVDEMHHAQPEGPYQLGGWSVGGILAFEMAQQLTALGQEVSVLVLIDSYLPRTSQGLPRLSLDLILTKMMREYGLDLSPHALNKLKGHSRLNGLLDRVKAAGHIPATFTPAEFRKLLLRYARVFRERACDARLLGPSLPCACRAYSRRRLHGDFPAGAQGGLADVGGPGQFPLSSGRPLQHSPRAVRKRIS